MIQKHYEIYHVTTLFNQRPENVITTIGKWMLFKGFIEKSPNVQSGQGSSNEYFVVTDSKAITKAFCYLLNFFTKINNVFGGNLKA